LDLQITEFLGDEKKNPLGKASVYIIQQKRGQSNAEDIVVRARHCTLQAKLCVLKEKVSA
jgi:hypothetical protein